MREAVPATVVATGVTVQDVQALRPELDLLEAVSQGSRRRRVAVERHGHAVR
jgi:hypothetical protein